MKDDINSKELAIEYPCMWRYKIIVSSASDMQALLKEVLKSREHSVKFSHKSKEGGYKSYNLDILVFDSEDREALFEALKTKSEIKFIL
ncbi:MAG: DUF493 domain-containing protein [Campylobacteraceae bacterium]|jgi:putative lipoic acid-binding regulatory protein|nr:DUF493 domain-containing protein [Campylobacteraceae bacterium]